MLRFRRRCAVCGTKRHRRSGAPGSSPARDVGSMSRRESAIADSGVLRSAPVRSLKGGDRRCRVVRQLAFAGVSLQRTGAIFSSPADLFALQDHRRPCPLALGMAPVVDVPGGHGENTGRQHQNVDQQEDEIEIVECFHRPQGCKIRASACRLCRQRLHGADDRSVEIISLWLSIS